MTTDDLRAEFPLVDMAYVRQHAPQVRWLAVEYNDARSRVDPADPRSIERARKVKARMLAKVDA